MRKVTKGLLIIGGLLRVLALFLPVVKSHSDTTKLGFENLSGFLDRSGSVLG